MSSEKKVFDVAKPGSSAPEIGSKPMVAGHKMMKDPSVTENDENKEPSNSIAQTSKIKIEPLSEEEKVENDTVVEGTEDNKQDNELNQTVNKEDIEDQKIEDDNPVVKPTTEEKSIEDKPELSSENENIEQSEADKAAGQEENLQKIIKEKTYNVPIKEASFSAFKAFVKTFIIVFLLGIVIIAVLIDAEIVDLGIELPFNFL